MIRFRQYYVLIDDKEYLLNDLGLTVSAANYYAYENSETYNCYVEYGEIINGFRFPYNSKEVISECQV